MQSPAFSWLTVVLYTVTVTVIAFVFDVEFYDAGAHQEHFSVLAKLSTLRSKQGATTGPDGPLEGARQ